MGIKPAKLQYILWISILGFWSLQYCLAIYAWVVTHWISCGMNKWAASWQNQQMANAPSEDPDQPGHPPSLIRVFAVPMKKAWVFSYPLSISDWVDAQANLCLCWAHMSVCWPLKCDIQCLVKQIHKSKIFLSDAFILNKLSDLPLKRLAM